MSYHLKLFGRPALKRGSDTVPLSSRKGQALLWYLATRPDESFPRKHLHDLLWDNVPADAGSRSFNTMFSRLQAELPVPCIDSTWNRLQWNAQAGVIIDTQQFSNMTRIVESPGPFVSTDEYAHLTDEDRDALYRAADLWTGPFLDGFACPSETYETWIRSEQARWEARILHVLKVLLHLEMRANRWEHVIEIARSALEIDPLREVFHRASMQALSHQGNRAAALAQFEWCRDVLREQLGADPDAMTLALYDAIKVSGTPSGISIPTRMSTESPAVLPANVGWMKPPTHPLVGRRREYGLIRAVLQGIASGERSHGVLLSGEAGIGKTRLLTEIVETASGRRLENFGYGTVLLGSAYETMVDVPYAVFIEALEGAIHAVDLSELNVPDIWLRELGRLLPEVHEFRPDLGTPGPMASGDDRLRLFQAVARFFSTLPQPVFLAFEDLQWADSLSLALLSYLIRSTQNNLKLASMLTVRSGDEPDEIRLIFRTLEREQLLTRIELSNLTDADTVTLVKTLFPEGNLDNGQRVFEQSNGHPLYTVELANMLRDADREQQLNDQEQPFDVNATPPQTAAPEETDTPSKSARLPVPPTVQDVFMGRLTRLGPIAVAVAEALAVFRHEANVEQLQHVAAISEAETVAGLNALVAARIVTEINDESLAFNHEVFRQVMLGRSSQAQRVYLHRRAYDALSKQSPATIAVQTQQQADLIAHAASGRLWDEAVFLTRDAADTAERLSAFPTAVERLEQALEYIAQLPDTAEHRKQALEIQLHIAKLDYWSAPAARDARLAEISARALTEGVTSLLPHVQLAKATSFIAQGRCPEATAILESLTPLAATEPVLAIQLDAWHAAIALIVGDVKRALIYFDRVKQVTEGNPDHSGTSLHAGMAACYAALGEFDKAEAALAEMVAEEKAQGYPEFTGTFFTTAATVAVSRRDWHAAVEHARQGIRTARAADDAYNETLSALWLGAAFIELGETEDAIRALKGALETSEQAQTYLRRDFIYAYLASAYVQTGQYERADAAVTAGLEVAERFGYKEGYALCTETRGCLAAARAEYHPADRERHLAIECFTDALARFDSLSIVAGSKRCREQLASLAQCDGAAPT